MTVQQRMRKYTDREIKEAWRAYKFMDKMKYPPLSRVVKMIRGGYQKDYHFTARDIEIAYDICGTPEYRLGGYMKGYKQAVYKPADVNPDVLLSRKEQTASMDILTLSGMNFLVASFKPLCYAWGNHLPSKTKEDIISKIKDAKHFLDTQGYKLDTIRFDREPGVEWNTRELTEQLLKYDIGAVVEHVSDIENFFKTLREDLRTVLWSLPYTLPQELVIHWFKSCVVNSNYFPGEQTEHVGVSPDEALNGEKKSAKDVYRFVFGDFVYSYPNRYKNRPRNKNEKRGEFGIALYSTGARDGSWMIYLLKSRVARPRRKSIPQAASQNLIDTVNSWKPNEVSNSELGLADESGAEYEEYSDEPDNSEKDTNKDNLFSNAEEPYPLDNREAENREVDRTTQLITTSLMRM